MSSSFLRPFLIISFFFSLFFLSLFFFIFLKLGRWTTQDASKEVRENIVEMEYEAVNEDLSTVLARINCKSDQSGTSHCLFLDHRLCLTRDRSD